MKCSDRFHSEIVFHKHPDRDVYSYYLQIYSNESFVLADSAIDEALRLQDYLDGILSNFNYSNYHS